MFEKYATFIKVSFAECKMALQWAQPREKSFLHVWVYGNKLQTVRPPTPPPPFSPFWASLWCQDYRPVECT